MGNDFKENVVKCFKGISATSLEFKNFGTAVCVFPVVSIGQIKIKINFYIDPCIPCL